MSQPHEHEHEHDEHDDAQLEEEDIVEVHDDDGQEYDEPMDEDEGYESDGDNAKYDGEIVIGAPANEEEEEEYARMQEDEARRAAEDNSWGANALHASQQSVFTVQLHPSFPNPPLAISGGEDDAGFIYSPVPSSSGAAFNADTFAPVKLTGHTDSVVSVGWSSDGEMVATGGMDGRVRIWRRVKGRRSTPPASEVGNGGVGEWKDWEFLTSLETGSEIQWLTWHPKGPVLAAGCEDSSVWLWQLPSGNTLTVLSSHTLPATCGIFPPPNGRQILTSSLDSSLILWEVSSSSPIFKTSIFCPPNNPEVDPSRHGITALAVSPNGQIAAVGGASGLVKIVGLEKGNILTTLRGHAEGESVESLVFIDLLNGAGGGKGVVLASAGTDGKGFVWDVNTGRVRSELSHDEPITSLAPHPFPNLHLLTSGSADGSLKTWDVRTGALMATHKGHAGVVNGVAVAKAPEGSEAKDVIVSAGDEGVSLIWKL